MARAPAGARNTRGLGLEHTFMITTNKDSTATVHFQHARSTGSTETYGVLGSASGYALTTGETRTISFTGPLNTVRPRIEDATTGGIGILLTVQGPW